MKSPLLLLSLVFLVTYTHAQLGYFENNHDTFVFSDTAYIRNAPSTSSKLIDTLLASHRVWILETTEKNQTIRGIEAPWLKVRYTKNNQVAEGYIWSGLLALAPLYKDDMKFVCGISRIFYKDTTIVFKDDPKQSMRDTIRMMSLEIKVFKGVERVVSFKRLIEHATYPTAIISEGKGLKNVDDILSLSFGGEACGVPTNTYHYGYRNKQIIPLYETMSVGDAGVYYHEEKLIFPAEKGGKPNVVLFKEQTEEATDRNDKHGEPIFKTTKSTKTLLWDGTKLTEQKKAVRKS
ncbi:SH3 domain-containing protein [Taibaiella soli]|uniref:SH3b domain-containing protein n=1 Tax=Taibaiella soli TaxID=1649169 RepID=A0A2W2B9B9_9BACT|nr:SH3 domain-containing protein [Taibaiella soli]PZF72507.1 hypothetical protein DN068_11620 [Taibaiella soli]